MKYLFVSFSTLCLFLGSANAQNQERVDQSQDLPVNNGMAEQFTGSFDSKRGVMDPVSCHGFNIGYLKTDDGNKIICFDRLKGGEDLNINCENNVWVQGYTELHTANPNGSCPGDVKYVFFVTEWHCR